VQSSSAPAHFDPDVLVGDRVSGEWNGVRVQGNYDVSLLVESGILPPGYVVVAASMGKNVSGNVIGFREHPDPSQQGLRQIAGIGPYPVTDSHFARCFGVGTRHRGAACVIQVTTGSTYTPPNPNLIPI